MVKHVENLTLDASYFSKQSLEGGLVKVLMYGFQNGVGVLVEHPPDLLELPLAPLD